MYVYEGSPLRDLYQFPSWHSLFSPLDRIELRRVRDMSAMDALPKESKRREQVQKRYRGLPKENRASKAKIIGLAALALALPATGLVGFEYEVDKDRDGIDDNWEKNGPYRNFLNPNKPNVLVEIDYHHYNDDPVPSFSEAAKIYLTQLFASRGIDLYIDTGGVAETGGGQILNTDTTEPMTGRMQESIEKSPEWFSPERYNSFHYASLSSRALLHAAGEADIGGNSFTILGSNNPNAQAMVFLHEIGHNFGFAHSPNADNVMCADYSACEDRVIDFTPQQWSGVKEYGLRNSLDFNPLLDYQFSLVVNVPQNIWDQTPTLLLEIAPLLTMYGAALYGGYIWGRAVQYNRNKKDHHNTKHLPYRERKQYHRENSSSKKHWKKE